MVDKAETKIRDALMRLEPKAMDLFGAVCSANFMVDNTIIEEAKTADRERRYVIDISEADFSALAFTMTALTREATAFREFFYRELEGYSHE
jgi:hypothetical protein